MTDDDISASTVKGSTTSLNTGTSRPGNTKSYAQVAGFVSRKSVKQNPSGLKPDISRSCRLVIRFSKKERATIVSHAESARMTISQYARLTLLKAPSLDPQRNKYLMRANYELTRQGINLNQIAKQFNGGEITSDEAINMLSGISHPIGQALNDLRAAIASTAKHPY
ncbi:MAG: plasmid mobilization relaxosome protein MobC [Alphaproteobacteria bacterium]|nr:plasmid mobilization relaxosome protein MobC [Alphaproteobacteria bacterium]